MYEKSDCSHVGTPCVRKPQKQCRRIKWKAGTRRNAEKMLPIHSSKEMEGVHG